MRATTVAGKGGYMRNRILRDLRRRNRLAFKRYFKFETLVNEKRKKCMGLIELLVKGIMRLIKNAVSN